MDARLAARYPGDRGAGQPVHTVYISAAEAGPATVIEWGAAALELLDRQPEVFAELGDETVLAMVRERLRTAPIADLRLDFEDGYGRRADEIEDADALRAGDTLRGLGIGSSVIRIKGLTAADRRLSVRTLELVLDGGVPAGFVFTVPK
ncbi:aldolase, partial [Mycolicibacterium diernhoferi]